MPHNRVGVMASGDAERGSEERDANASANKRPWPNVVLCGTPGTGKSSLARQLLAAAAAQLPRLPLAHVDLSKYAVEQQLTDGWDEVLNCAVLDEDKVLAQLLPRLRDGGLLLDYHSADFLPEELIDLVVVLRCDNTLLYDRLKARNYPEGKISNNLECEIFQTILDEAREAFPEETVRELPSDTPQQQADNLQTLLEWLRAWPDAHAAAPP